jgi:hypothetical protein
MNVWSKLPFRGNNVASRVVGGGVIAAVTAMLAVWAGAQESPSPFANQYALAVYETPAEFDLRTDKTAKGAEYWKGWGTYHQAMLDAGIMRGGMPLKPGPEVRQVRVRDGKVQTKEGPLAAGEPVLSGFFLIEVDSLEKAIEWAAKAPNASTSVVEVRPAFPAAMPAIPK